MINLACCEPPKSVPINGREYPINWDFRIWIEISELFGDMLPFNNPENLGDNIELLIDIFRLAFPEIPNEPMPDILNAVNEFLKGYPKPKTARSSVESASGEPLYSFSHDLNYIIIAIRNQSGIDLSYRRTEPFHWWEFMLEFEALEDRHYISKIIGYRAYKGKDKDCLKLKRHYAIPRRTNKNADKLIELIDKEFYNA